MPYFLSKNDFTGLYALNFNLNSGAKIDAYIAEFEPYYLAKIFGGELMELLYDESEDERIEKLIEPIVSNTVYYGGIKSILLGLIYFEYVTNSEIKNTGAGMKTLQVETAKGVNLNLTQVYSLYNIGVKNSRAVQKFVHENKADYTEFSGKELLYNSYF